MARETFVEYGAGSDWLPWIGWLEDETGEVTGFVDLDGNIMRKTGDTWTGETGGVAPRNGAWNAVRDAVRAAANLPKGHDPRADHWPASSIACLFSLVMREIGCRISDAAGAGGHPGSALNKSRLVSMLRETERLFAAAEFFDLGKDIVSAPPRLNRTRSGLSIRRKRRLEP